jgi:hypothetical protein
MKIFFLISNILLLFFQTPTQVELISRINSNLNAFSYYQETIKVDKNKVLTSLCNDKFYFRAVDLNEVTKVKILYDPTFKIGGIAFYTVTLYCPYKGCVRYINNYSSRDGGQNHFEGNDLTFYFQNKQKAELTLKLYEVLLKK